MPVLRRPHAHCRGLCPRRLTARSPVFRPRHQNRTPMRLATTSLRHPLAGALRSRRRATVIPATVDTHATPRAVPKSRCRAQQRRPIRDRQRQLALTDAGHRISRPSHCPIKSHRPRTSHQPPRVPSSEAFWTPALATAFGGRPRPRLAAEAMASAAATDVVLLAGGVLPTRVSTRSAVSRSVNRVATAARSVSRRSSRSLTFVLSALIWSSIVDGVLGMVAFSSLRSIGMIDLAGVYHCNAASSTADCSVSFD